VKHILHLAKQAAGPRFTPIPSFGEKLLLHDEENYVTHVSGAILRRHAGKSKLCASASL
jgi:hypothetical protein